MRRKGPLVFTFLAVVLALTAAWGSQRWLNAQARQAAASRIPEGKVVVAAVNLDAGQKLDRQHLSTISWPKANLPTGHYPNTKNLIGRVIKGPVVKGEVMLPSKLAEEGLTGGLSAVVPAGSRALTVKVDEVIGVAGFVQAGDRVDVYVTVASGNYIKDPVTRMVLQDVKVLAIGEQIQKERDPNSKNAKAKKVTVVTLQVDPVQGEKLALSSSEGKLHLALRNQGDRQDASTDGIRMTALMPAPVNTIPATVKPEEPAPKAEEKAKAAPAPKITGPQVEVIKGVTRSVQSL